MQFNGFFSLIGLITLSPKLRGRWTDMADLQLNLPTKEYKNK